MPDQPIFGDLRERFGGRLPGEWPDPQSLNGLLPGEVETGSGARLRFVTPVGASSALAYEQGIYTSGEVPTRRGWHDVFNALMWCCFPRTKVALNAAHVADANTSEQSPRSRRRDALTLFDEAGVVLAAADPGWPEIHGRHDWERMFLMRRGDWFTRIRPYLIGHGLYEQCLNPYLGLTGKAIYVEVDHGLFDRPLEEQYRQIDERLQTQVEALNTPRGLLPLPILGIPGWYPDNEDPQFYGNAEYFRPAR